MLSVLLNGFIYRVDEEPPISDSKGIVVLYWAVERTSRMAHDNCSFRTELLKAVKAQTIALQPLTKPKPGFIRQVKD